MASSARIDELRKKFDENPRRYFAPLANEYRKVGDLDQAIFICQEYLPQQPGHMSGHIVYGQTLFDLGRDEEAKAVFETALTLDPENLIALKHLGDIARQGGDLDGARGWYQRVLEADPRNDEIMQVLESLGGGGIDGGRSEAGYGSSIAAANDLASGTAAATGDLDSETSLPIETAPEVVLEITPPSSVHAVDSTSLDPAAALFVEQAVDAEMPVAEAATTEFAEASDAPADAANDELLDLTDFSFETVEIPTDDRAASETEETSFALVDATISGAEHDEPSVAENSEEPEPPVELATDLILGLADDSAEVPSLASSESIEIEPTSPVDEDLTRAIGQLEGLETFSIDAPVEEPPELPAEPAQPASDTFATETMAELYAQQGHLESAMEIYEQLMARSPDDAELRRRAGEVESQLRGAPAQYDGPPMESPSEPVVAEAAPPIDSAAAEISSEPAVAAGPTIREFFREILDRRSAGSNDGEFAAPGSEISDDFAATTDLDGSLDALFFDAPTPDADHSAAMSLAQAFGAETPDADESPTMHGTPAHPAADELSLDHVFRSATPAKGTAAAGGFSLDQFFSGELAGDATEGLSEPAPPRSSDDIAQFNAWLNGLKKT